MSYQEKYLKYKTKYKTKYLAFKKQFDQKGGWHLDIPQETTSIGTNAYKKLQITSIKIPNSVTSIGLQAFEENNLTIIEIPDSVTSIGDLSFYKNQLSSIKMLDSVKSIGFYAFSNNNLTSIKIPDSVTSIDDGAFAYNQLTSVVIPDYVITIGNGAFKDNQLTKVIMPSIFNTNEHRARIFGSNYNTRNILFNQHLEISLGTTRIGDAAFISSKLTSVEIPDSVASIGNISFYKNQLSSIKMLDSVKSIGYYAFSNNNLTSIKIPDSVTSIDDGAFAYNQLTSVIIPDSVITIGKDAFKDNQLSKVIMPSIFNTDEAKKRIFLNFRNISFIYNDRLFPTIAPVINLVEEHSIFDTIENELKKFGLNLKLGTIDELRDQFKNLVDDPLNFATFTEGIDASGSKQLEFNRVYSDGTKERKNFTFDKHLSAGSFNTTDIYIDKNTPNNKEYIFRSSKSSTSSTFEDQFKSFYENLKHIILYIIIRKRLGNIKFIPQPYHFGVKKNTSTGEIKLYMIMEKGKATLGDYIQNTTTLTDVDIKKLIFSIYCDLYELSFLCMKEGDISTLLKFKHNDFKLNNLVVSESGAPLIIDFGFSQFTLTDTSRSIEFVSCEASRLTSTYYDLEPNGFNVIHDMLHLLSSFNSINKRGFKPFEIFKFVKNPGSNILDTDVIVGIINFWFGAWAHTRDDLYTFFYDNFDLKNFKGGQYTIDITPSQLADNIGLTLADKIIDKFEKKYRKYKMKYLNLVAKLKKSS